MERVSTLLDQKYFLKKLLEEDELSKTYSVWHVEWEIPLTLQILKNTVNNTLRIKQAQEWVGLGIHPNLISAYFYREIEGNHCLVLENIIGRCLSDLQHRIRSDFHETLRVLLELSHGLEFLHEENQIYGNIHSQNVILDTYGRVKLHKIRWHSWETIEMLAKGMRPNYSWFPWENWDKSKLRQHALTKLYYQPPEYFSSKSFVPNTTSDAYAYGILAYELICGQMPFFMEDDLENLWIAFRKKHSQKESLTFPNISAGLTSIIQACLHKNPKQRPIFSHITSLLQKIYADAFGEEYVFEDFPQNALWAMSINNQALGRIEQGNTQEAEQQLREVTLLHSLSIIAPLNNRLLKLRYRNTPLGDFWQKIRKYELVSDVRFYLLCAKICLEYGSLVPQVYQEIAGINTEDNRIKEVKGDLEYRLGYYQKAYDAYKNLATKEIGTNIWYRWGAAALSLKLNKDVQYAWSKGIAQDLPLWDLTVGYSMFLATQGQWAKARQSLETAAKNFGRYIRYSSPLEEGVWSNVRILSYHKPESEIRSIFSTTKTEVFYLDRPISSFWNVCIAHDKRYIFGRTEDQNTYIWDWPLGKRLTSNSNTAVIPMMPRATTCQASSLCPKNQAPKLVICSENGEIAIILAESHNLCLWDMREQKIVQELSGHSDIILSVAITPDGKLAISGSMDHTVRVWDLEMKMCVAVLRGHEDIVHAVAITENGKRAISVSWDKTLWVWDLNNFSWISIFVEPQYDITAVTIHNEGLLAASSNSNNQINIWDVTTKKISSTIQGHTSSERITCLSFSQDGQMLVAGTTRGNISVYEDISQRICPLQHRSHYFLATLPPPIPLAERQAKMQLQKEVFDPAQQKFPKIFKDYESWCNLQRDTSVPEILLGFTQSLCAKAYEIGYIMGDCTGIRHMRTFIHDSPVLGFIFPEIDHFFSLTEKGTLLKWYLKGSNSEFFWHKFAGSIQSIDFCPVSKQFGFSSREATIFLWNREEDSWNGIECHTQQLYSFKISIDGKKGFAGTGEGTLQCWDLKEEYLIQEVVGHKEMISQIALIGNNRLVTGGLDGNIILWNAETLAPIWQSQPKCSPILSIHASNTCILSGSIDGTLRQWSLQNGLCQGVIKISSVPIVAISTAHHESLVLVGTQEGNLFVYSLASRKLLTGIKAHFKPIQHVYFSPDAQWAFSSSLDSTIRAWKLEWQWWTE